MENKKKKTDEERQEAMNEIFKAMNRIIEQQIKNGEIICD